VVAQRGGSDFALSAAIYCARINGALRRGVTADQPIRMTYFVDVAYWVAFKGDGFASSV
jgi:hypothetical protein